MDKKFPNSSFCGLADDYVFAGDDAAAEGEGEPFTWFILRTRRATVFDWSEAIAEHPPTPQP